MLEWRVRESRSFVAGSPYFTVVLEAGENEFPSVVCFGTFVPYLPREWEKF